MSSMLEDIKPETADMIKAQAKAHGLSVDQYLRDLLTSGNGSALEEPLYLSTQNRLKPSLNGLPAIRPFQSRMTAAKAFIRDAVNDRSPRHKQSHAFRPADSPNAQRCA